MNDNHIENFFGNSYEQCEPVYSPRYHKYNLMSKLCKIGLVLSTTSFLYGGIDSCFALTKKTENIDGKVVAYSEESRNSRLIRDAYMASLGFTASIASGIGVRVTSSRKLQSLEDPLPKTYNIESV